MIAPMAQLDIQVDAASMTYGSGQAAVEVLDHLTFSVERGDLCCVVGPSGCGKTTLLRILLGLIQPTSGLVTLAPDRVEQGIAYVQQFSPLLPWRTVLQNAALGLEIRGRLNEASLQHVRAQVQRIGLTGFEDRVAKEISGGMRQRTAIVQALEARPGLLFCDEPFSAIDFVGRLELSAHFKRMCRVQGVTTVFVTHNIEEAIYLADKIIVLGARPARLINEHLPRLSQSPEDPVECRRSPEFEVLFQKVWDELKPAI